MAFALDFEKPGYKQSGLGRTDSREQKWQDSGKGARSPRSTGHHSEQFSRRN